jgi:hypothetical protein
MEIRITTSQLSKIADSISRYVFAEVKTSKERQDMKWLSDFTRFYQSLKNNKKLDEEFVIVNVDGIVKSDLADVIGKHIFEEIQTMQENDNAWMFEMVNIYNQLIENESDVTGDADVTGNTDTSSEEEATSQIKDNYDSEIRYSSISVDREKDEENEKEKIEEDDSIITESDFVMLREDDSDESNQEESYEIKDEIRSDEVEEAVSDTYIDNSESEVTDDELWEETESNLV